MPDVDAYLAEVPTDARAALEKLRKTIRAACPEAIEVISYGIPAFKHRGRGLVAYAAFKNHCSLFPMSKAVTASNMPELKEYESGKGTLRFTVVKPLPVALVSKIVKARIAENAELEKEKAHGRKNSQSRASS